MTHSDTIWQIISALAVMLTVLATYIKTRTERREQHTETATKLTNVERIVNGQTEAKDARIAQLEQALTAAGVETPKAQTENS